MTWELQNFTDDGPLLEMLTNFKYPYPVSESTSLKCFNHL